MCWLSEQMMDQDSLVLSSVMLLEHQWIVSDCKLLESVMKCIIAITILFDLFWYQYLQCKELSRNIINQSQFNTDS